MAFSEYINCRLIFLNNYSACRIDHCIVTVAIQQKVACLNQYLDGDGGTGGGRLGPANPPYILAEIQAKRDLSKDLVLGLAPTPQICQPSEASDQYREAVNEKAK